MKTVGGAGGAVNDLGIRRGGQILFFFKERFNPRLPGRLMKPPGVGFGPMGEGHVRFALVENDQRIRQATRAIGAFLKGVSNTPAPPRPMSALGSRKRASEPEGNS